MEAKGRGRRLGPGRLRIVTRVTKSGEETLLLRFRLVIQSYFFEGFLLHDFRLSEAIGVSARRG